MNNMSEGCVVTVCESDGYRMLAVFVAGKMDDPVGTALATVRTVAGGDPEHGRWVATRVRHITYESEEVDRGE